MSNKRSAEKKKVLLITNDFPPCFSGGISNFYFNLCMYSPSDMFRIITPNCDKAEDFDREMRLDVIRVNAPSQRSVVKRILQIVFFMIAVFRQCFKREIAAVWCGHVYLLPIAYLTNLLFRIPFFIIIVGGEYDRYFRVKTIARLLRRITDKASFMIAISRFGKTEIRREWKYKGHIPILHPGVDIERFRIKEKPAMEEPDMGFILLTVGTLVKRKGHDQVLRALATLKDEISGFEYTIIGDGPERGRLERLAYEELDLQGKVRFLGFVEDSEMIENYRKADVFIMPSRMLKERRGTEGFGIVYLEANACGLPVIAGDTGGVSDAVLNGETGLLVNPESVSEIASAIKIFRSNPGLVKDFGLKGRKRVVEDFRCEHISSLFEQMIREHVDF